MSEKGDLGFSPTVPWAGPQTNKPRPAFDFNAAREKAAAEQAATDSDLVSVLSNCGLPKLAAQVLGRRIQELELQLTLLRNLPPHLAKAERRG
jgi:hypothetical protein